MPKPLVILSEVIAELDDALNWYAERSPALPGRFAAELRRTLLSVEKHPQQGAYYDDEHCFRYRKLAKFPHLVIYREQDDCIEVLAVAHTSRKHGYWRDRSK
jgi:toxin ParE1/3/4